jgi:hypothetical protein
MMMGVTYEMILNHIKETSSLPEAIYRGNDYFKTWNDLFEVTINGGKHLPIEFLTFEGSRYSCDLELG